MAFNRMPTMMMDGVSGFLTQDLDALYDKTMGAIRKEGKEEDRMTKYQQRMLELEIQSLQEAMRLYDPIHVEEQNRMLRQQLRRLHEENFTLSRHSQEAAVAMRGEMVRLRNMLEDEFRSRLNEAEGRVKEDVFTDLSRAIDDAVQQRNGLYAALQSLTGGITMVTQKYNQSQAHQRQVKVDAAIVQGVYDQQTVLMVKLRQQLAAAEARAKTAEEAAARGSSLAAAAPRPPSPRAAAGSRPGPAPMLDLEDAVQAETEGLRRQQAHTAEQLRRMRAQMEHWRARALVLDDELCRHRRQRASESASISAAAAAEDESESEAQFLLSIWHRKHAASSARPKSALGTRGAATQTDPLPAPAAPPPPAPAAGPVPAFLPPRMRRPTSSYGGGRWAESGRPFSAYETSRSGYAAQDAKDGFEEVPVDSSWSPRPSPRRARTPGNPIAVRPFTASPAPRPQTASLATGRAGADRASADRPLRPGSAGVFDGATAAAARPRPSTAGGERGDELAFRRRMSALQQLYTSKRPFG